eukprot:scaffold74978_cov44-Prasinocladus_malaysianus.AAC.1
MTFREGSPQWRPTASSAIAPVCNTKGTCCSNDVTTQLPQSINDFMPYRCGRLSQQTRSLRSPSSITGYDPQLPRRTLFNPILMSISRQSIKRTWQSSHALPIVSAERAHRDSVTLGPGEVKDSDEALGETMRNLQLADEYENRRNALIALAKDFRLKRAKHRFTGRGALQATLASSPCPTRGGQQWLKRLDLPMSAEVVDPSRFYGKGGSSARKVWSKGIPGYTGHQPTSDQGSYGK